MTRLVALVAFAAMSFSSLTVHASDLQTNNVAQIGIGNIEVGGVDDSSTTDTNSMLRYLIWAAFRGQGMDVDLNFNDGKGQPSPEYRIDVNYFELGTTFVSDIRLIESSSGALVGTAIGQGPVSEVVGRLEEMALTIATSMLEVTGGDVSVAFGQFDYKRKRGIPMLRPSRAGRDVRNDICGGDLSVALRRAVDELEDLEVLETSGDEIYCKGKITAVQIASNRHADLVVSGLIEDEKAGVVASVSITSGESAATATVSSMFTDSTDYDTFRDELARKVTGYLSGILQSWDDRAEVYKSFIESDSSGLSGHATRYRDEGNPNLAVMFYQQATTLDPENAFAFNALAELYQELQSSYTAKQVLWVANEAVRLEPNDTDYRWDLANALTLTGRFEDALEEINRIDTGDQSVAWRATMSDNRAQLYTFLGEYEKAKSSYQKAFELDSTNVNPALDAAGLYAVEGDYAGAVTVLEGALEVLPDADLLQVSLVDNYMQLSDQYFVEEDYGRSLATLRKSQKIDPENVDTLLDISYLEYEIEHNFDASYAAITEAIRIETESFGSASDVILRNAAEPALAVGKTKEATQYASDAILKSTDPLVASVMHFVMATAAFIEGDSRRGNAALEELFASAEQLNSASALVWAWTGTEKVVTSTDLDWGTQQFLLDVIGYLQGVISFDDIELKRATWRGIQ